MWPGEMDDTLAIIRKKLKKQRKGKDGNDFGAVAECGAEVQILVQQEDVQGGVHTGNDVAGEESNLSVVKLGDVEIAGDGTQQIGRAHV